MKTPNHYNIGILFSFLLVLVSCDNNNNKDELYVAADKGEGSIIVPAAIQMAALPISNTQVFLTVNASNGGSRIPMTLNPTGTTAQVTISDLKVGISYSFLIEFEYITNTDGIVKLATATTDIVITPGDNALSFTKNSYVYPDNDGDGYINLVELENGTSPNNSLDYPSFRLQSSATLYGPQIGDNSASLSLLRKPVNFNIVTANANYSFGNAYGARTTSTSTAFIWIVPVTNLTNQVVCFLKLTNGSLKSSTGAILALDDISYVNGTTHKISSAGIHTNACLAAQETGHFIGIELGLYDQIASIEFNTIEYTSLGSSSDLAITPLSYTASPPNSSSQDMSLTIKNYGPVPGLMNNLSLSIFLDANNEPLMWEYFKLPTTWDGVLQVVDVGSLTTANVYEGSSNLLLVYLEFDVAPVSLSSQPLALNNREAFATTEEYNKYLLNSRNLNESYKQNMVYNAN